MDFSDLPAKPWCVFQLRLARGLSAGSAAWPTSRSTNGVRGFLAVCHGNTAVALRPISKQDGAVQKAFPSNLNLGLKTSPPWLSSCSHLSVGMWAANHNQRGILVMRREKRNGRGTWVSEAFYLIAVLLPKWFLLYFSPHVFLHIFLFFFSSFIPNVKRSMSVRSPETQQLIYQCKQRRRKFQIFSRSLQRKDGSNF